jgi:hypothetical protein
LQKITDIACLNLKNTTEHHSVSNIPLGEMGEWLKPTVC